MAICEHGDAIRYSQSQQLLPPPVLGGKGGRVHEDKNRSRSPVSLPTFHPFGTTHRISDILRRGSSLDDGEIKCVWGCYGGLSAWREQRAATRRSSEGKDTRKRARAYVDRAQCSVQCVPSL